jgi:hypothetical protein
MVTDVGNGMMVYLCLQSNRGQNGTCVNMLPAIMAQYVFYMQLVFVLVVYYLILHRFCLFVFEFQTWPFLE